MKPLFALLLVSLAAVAICDDANVTDAEERNDPFQSDWICRDDLIDQANLVPDCPFRRIEGDACDPANQRYECNCGCGTYDPDCDLPTRFRPKNTSDDANWYITCGPTLMVADGRYTFCQQQQAKCITVPLDWTCEANMYNEYEYADENPALSYNSSDCDCQCGRWDPDCSRQGEDDVAVRCGTTDENEIFENWQVRHFNDQVCASNLQCMPVPAGWTCPAIWYNELESGIRRSGSNKPFCDCGCGIPDPDCLFEQRRATIGFEFFGLNCNGADGSDEVDLSLYCNLKELTCNQAPEGWTCPSRYYSEETSGSFGPNNIPDCNCGCGLMDPDCLLGQKRRNGRAGLLCRWGTRDDELQPSSTDMELQNYCVYTGVGTETTCTSAPRDWAPRCVSSFYDQTSTSSIYSTQDGHGVLDDLRCDCACGQWDPDCNDRNNTLFCNPDQSKFEPTTGDFWCSPVTLQCRSGPSPAENSSAWIAYFDELTYGVAPDRTIPSCDCGMFTEWDPDCDLQSSVLRGTIDSVCANDEYCSVTTNECVAIAEPAFVRGPDCAAVLYDQLNSATYGELGIPTCDCGCGVWDPDCDSALLRYQYDGSLFELNCFDGSDIPSADRSSFCMKSSNTCGQAPSAWYGAPEWFNETNHQTIPPGQNASCHCGVGMYDPDCALTGNRTLEVVCGPSAAPYVGKKCSSTCPNCVPDSVSRQIVASAFAVTPNMLFVMVSLALAWALPQM